MSIIFFLCIISAASLLFIKTYSKIACSLGLYDRPNKRSSHTKPIPLGAGLTFVLCLIPAVLYLKYQGTLQSNSFYLLAIGATFCTLLGFIDDIRHLTPRLRLSIQVTIAVTTLLYLTNFLSIPFEVKFIPFNNSYISLIFGILFVTWMINLFNFVDGLDGLLGSQVFLYGLASYYLCLTSNNPSLGVVYLIISALTLPFLIFNWRPAKIFMGDAGAYFFGFTFAFLGLLGKIEYGQSLVASVILMSPIISDATYTLMIRIKDRKKIFGAHRDHLFHTMLDSKRLRPSRVVALYASLTLFFTAPTAYFATINNNSAVVTCLLTYAFTLVIYLLLKKIFSKEIKES